MIYIVIPVYNRLKYTQACLDCLFKQNVAEYKVIVVDHGSTDGTSEVIARDYPEVILLQEDESLWWAGATNKGIQRALKLSRRPEDFILTLNNDLIVKPGYLSELLRVYYVNRPAIVGSLSVHINNADKIDFAGVKWNKITAKFRKPTFLGIPLSKLKTEHEWLETDLLPGRGTLFPISVFRKLGLFDETKFPHYAADEDFALTCKRNGYQLLIAVNAGVESYVDETGINYKHGKLNFKQFLRSLRAKNSATNLSIRYRWAKKNSPVPVIYFFADVSRIFGSWFRSQLNG
jgi:GT2 family glycosyltransferase